MFARSTIPGIPEPQRVERATSMALTLFFLYRKPIASTGSYAGLYYHMKHHYLRLLLSLIAVGTIAQAPAQITLHEATNVTQTKATLSADFPDLSVEHGFQYKYGTLPEIDDFSRTALAPQSDPVQISTTGSYAWSARTAKGWVESNTDIAIGQSSEMTVAVEFTEATNITFEWSVDSEENIGILSFWVDNKKVEQISGDKNFTEVSYIVTTGNHTFKWQYEKLSSTNIGLDLGMVRNINFQNATPGEWLQKNVSETSLILENIYPSQNYLYRAFTQAEDTKSFSTIKEFSTKDVTLDKCNVTDITQTKALLKGSSAYGDALVETGFICSQKTRVGSSAIEYSNLDKAFLSDDTFGRLITIKYDSQWKYSKNYDYVYMSTHQVSPSIYATVNIEEETEMTFEWHTSGATDDCKFYVDGVEKASVWGTTYKKVTVKLSPGLHNLKWKAAKVASYNNVGTYIRNVSIPNLPYYDILESTSIVDAKSSYPDIIFVSSEANQFSTLAENLKPNTTYYLQSYIIPVYESCLTPSWIETKSKVITFTTQNVTADTLSIGTVTQSTAVIQGKVDGGDANIESIGLQYKNAESTRWTDYPKDVSTTELSQQIIRLKPNNKYDYRVYIQAHDCDTVFSTIGKFTTLPVEPKAPSILKLAQHEATLQGKVIFGDANIYQRGMQFRKKGISEWEEVEDGGNDSIYTLVRKNLEMGATYQARTYVQPAGCDVIYSDILEFKTLYSYFTAYNANNTTQTTATFEATISDVDEDTTVDEYGFEYYIYGDGFAEEENNFVPSEIYTIPVTPDGKTIKTTITELAPRLLLKWRAYAIVNGEKSYYAGSANSEWAYAATKPATIKATATKITPTSISLDLDATQDGDAVISQIEYALANSPMDAIEYSICGNNITLTGLLPNSKYNFRFRGLVNGRLCPLFDSVYQDYSWFTFTTPAADVDVKIINVTQTKAEMNIIIDAGEEAEVTDLRYRLSNYGNWTECSEKLSLSGLTPGQKYNVSIRAKINGIEYTWSEYEFTTRIVSATVYTSDIQQTSARIRWSTFQGDATLISSGVEIGSDKYEFTDDTRTVTITGLLPNTSYSVRSYAQTVEGGKIYSQYRTIKTSEIICTTTSATSISNRSATLNGTIDCDTRSSAEFGVQWKKMIGWNSDPAFTKGHKLDDGSISVALVNGMLDPDTDYQYRTAVRYKDKIYYGDWATFRTEAEYVYYPASVYTIFRTDRENNSLVLCGYYIAGSEAIVSQGYEYWKKNPNAIHPLATQSPAIVTTDESMQHVFAPGELPAGDYNVRAFVKTESGETIYGPTLGFTASNAGYSEVEEIPCDMPSVKVEHSIVKIYNAAGLECYVARINGIVVSSHTIPGDYDEIALSPGYYIIKLSNGLVEKIRL